MVRHIRRTTAGLKDAFVVKASLDEEGSFLSVARVGGKVVPTDGTTFESLLERTREALAGEDALSGKPVKVVFDDFVRGSKRDKTPLLVMTGVKAEGGYSASNLTNEPEIAVEGGSFSSLVENAIAAADRALGGGKSAQFGLPEKPRIRLVLEAPL